MVTTCLRDAAYVVCGSLQIRCIPIRLLWFSECGSVDTFFFFSPSNITHKSLREGWRRSFVTVRVAEFNLQTRRPSVPSVMRVLERCTLWCPENNSFFFFVCFSAWYQQKEKPTPGLSVTMEVICFMSDLCRSRMTISKRCLIKISNMCFTKSRWWCSNNTRHGSRVLALRTEL